MKSISPKSSNVRDGSRRIEKTSSGAPDDVFSILLDPSRTFEDFGEIDFTPLQETVFSAMTYYKEHGTLGEYTHLRLQDEK